MNFLLFLSVSLTTLSELPWVGDGRPEAKGADWYKDDPAPVFVAEFVMPRYVEAWGAAKMQVVSPGCYLLTVNGRPANGTGLATFPLWSPFDRTIYSETFPVGRYIKPHPATNRVQIILGNGWYNVPPLKFWGAICFRDNLAHGRPCFKAAIDGVSRLDWKWKTCNLVRNSFHLGETYDLTRAPDTTLRKAYEVAGPKGKIALREAPAIGALRLKPESGKSAWLREGEIQVVDFGWNNTSVYSFGLNTKGLKRGDRVTFVYGERLNADGSVNPLTQTAGQIKKPGMGGDGAPALAAQSDTVIVAGGEKGLLGFDNYFTWHVARYVEVRGLKELIKPKEAQRMPVGSQLRAVAPGRTFKSEKKDLEAIHELCVRTFKSNVMGVQSDCPGRERLQYGGDVAATCEAYALNFDMREFYLKTLKDFADEAAGDGWITETAPYVGIADANGLSQGSKDRRGPISWALGVPVLMDLVIRRYPAAKARALAFYPVCTRYVGLVNREYPKGLIPTCIGDHEALERAPNDLVATAHWHEFVRLTVKFARLLGKGDEAAKYNKIAEKIEKAFVAKYVGEDGVVGNGTQSAQAIALYLGLVPKDRLRAAETRLLKAIEEKDFAVTTGLFATRYMLLYLSEHGRAETAEKIVLHKGFPGWLHMIERGATTVWETWKESDDVYSNCHPMFGSVDEWILKYGNAK